jgi:hypothetical protein
MTVRVARNKRAVTTEVPAKMTTVTAARVVNNREAMALVKMTLMALLVQLAVNRVIAPPVKMILHTVKMTATVPPALQAVNRQAMALAKTTPTVPQVRLVPQAVNRQAMAPPVKMIPTEAPVTKTLTANLEINKTLTAQAKTIHMAAQEPKNQATAPPSRAIHTAVPVVNRHLPAKMTVMAAATLTAIPAPKGPVVLPAADKPRANLMIRMDLVIREVDWVPVDMEIPLILDLEIRLRIVMGLIPAERAVRDRLDVDSTEINPLRMIVMEAEVKVAVNTEMIQWLKGLEVKEVIKAPTTTIKLYLHVLVL